MERIENIPGSLDIKAVFREERKKGVDGHFTKRRFGSLGRRPTRTPDERTEKILKKKLEEARVNARLIEDTEGLSVDTSLSPLEYYPTERAGMPVFLAPDAIQRITDVIGTGYVEPEADEVDPEVLEVLIEETQRGNLNGAGPTLYNKFIARTVMHRAYPEEDDFGHESKP